RLRPGKRSVGRRILCRLITSHCQPCAGAAIFLADLLRSTALDEEYALLASQGPHRNWSYICHPIRIAGTALRSRTRQLAAGDHLGRCRVPESSDSVCNRGLAGDRRSQGAALLLALSLARFSRVLHLARELFEQKFFLAWRAIPLRRRRKNCSATPSRRERDGRALVKHFTRTGAPVSHPSAKMNR